MYPEAAPANAKSNVVVHGCPGLTRFCDIDTRRTRGLYRTSSDGRLYVVIRNTLYYVSPEGVATNLGTIAGSGRVGMSDNGTQLCIVAGATGYTYTVAGGLQVITDPDFPGADTVTFLDGFFIFNNASAGQRGQFFISNLLDGQMYDALDFATAEAYPDNLVRVFADHSQLLLFGAETIEVWFNAGLADFPFTRAQGSVIEQGLGARWSVAKLDETVVWLDNEGMVRSLQGNTPVRISTHAIEYEITRGDWNNATAWSYVEEGHQFYVLTVPAANLATQKAGTYVYDAATQLWHERKSYRQDYSRSGFYARAYGKHIVADIDRGRLYEQSLDVYEEDGEHLIAEMQFPQVQNDGKRFIVDRLQIDMEVGIAESVIEPSPEPFEFYTYSPSQYLIPSRLVNFNVNHTTQQISASVAHGTLSSDTYRILVVRKFVLEELTPSAGLTLLAEQQSTTNPEVILYVFGGFAGAETVSQLSWTTPDYVSITFLGVSNIDLGSPFNSVIYSPSIGQCTPTKDITYPVVSGDNSGVFCVPTFAASQITTTVSQWWGIVSNTRSGGQSAFLTDPVTGGVAATWHNLHEGLDLIEARRWLPENTKDFAGATLLLNKRSGTRPDPILNLTQFEEFLEDSLAGYAWALLKDEQVVNSGHGGFANKSSLIPMTDTTMSTVQSVTKIITEVVARILIRQGQLSMSSTVGGILSGAYTVPASFSSVTLYDLLRMTSGANNHFNNFTGTVQDYLDGGTTDPGLHREYENGDISLVGAMIEEVSGQSFEALAGTLVLEPLGVQNYSFDMDDNEILGYEYGSASTASYDPPQVASAAVSGLVTDLQGLQRMHWLFRSNLVLSQAEINQMLGDRARMRQTYTGRSEILQHGGSANLSGRGMRASFNRLSDGYDLVVINNAYDNSGNTLLDSVVNVLTNTE